MAFLDDLIDSIGGQSVAPQQTIIPTNELLSQAYGTAIGQAPNVIAYNQALAPGLTNVQLGVERLYDPNAALLRGATSKSILDELGLGTSLGQELQEDVIRNALEGTAASGFGVGQGGRGLVARDLGLTGMELARQRRGEALGAVRSSPSLSSLYQPSRGFSPEQIAGDIRDVQAAQDEFVNLQEDIRRQNFGNLLSTGFRIAGGVVGGIYGGAAGAQAGQAAGGGVIQGSQVRGVTRPQASGGIFSSWLSGLVGSGGGGSTTSRTTGIDYSRGATAGPAGAEMAAGRA